MRKSRGLRQGAHLTRMVSLGGHVQEGSLVTHGSFTQTQGGGERAIVPPTSSSPRAPVVCLERETFPKPSRGEVGTSTCSRSTRWGFFLGLWLFKPRRSSSSSCRQEAEAQREGEVT